MLWALPFFLHTVQADQKPLFRLVGVYDASSVLGVAGKRQSDFMWKPSKRMIDSCGPSKGPDALGLFEAEMVSNQMAPSLVVLLRHNTVPQYEDSEGNACQPEESLDCVSISRPSIRPDDITIGIGIDKVEYQLQPMINPRYLSINIEGYTEREGVGNRTSTDPENQDSNQDSNQEESKPIVFDTSRYQKLIRTQLEIETCLEHKVGRGWLGNDKNRLRQAFLLDPPDGDRMDRKYFSGQRDPIPAYLGPTDACIRSSAEMPKDVNASKGESSLSLTPSDVWGASLRDCEPQIESQGRKLLSPTRTVPLSLTENGIRQARKHTPNWSGLNIDVEARGPTEEDVYITVTYNDTKIDGLIDTKLFPEPGAMVDILARIPQSYPLIGPKEDPNQYVALIIPNWQIVEGLRRLYDRSCVDERPETYCTCSIRSTSSSLGTASSLEEKLNNMDQRLKCVDLDLEPCNLSREKQIIGEVGEETYQEIPSAAEKCLEKLDIDKAMPNGGQGIYDGVGWLLANPKHLYIQVPTVEDVKEGFQIMDYLIEKKESSSEQLPNLADATSGGFAGMQNWGYSVGLLNGRSPIALPIAERLEWDISARSQRSSEHSIFIVALFVLLFFVISGFRRIGDYWMRTPEERAYYWPGRQSSQDGPKPEGMDMEGAGAEGAEGAEDVAEE